MRNLRELTLANNQLKVGRSGPTRTAPPARTRRAAPRADARPATQAVPAEFASLTSLTELYLNGACGARPTVVPDELRQSSPARATGAARGP